MYCVDCTKCNVVAGINDCTECIVVAGINLKQAPVFVILKEQQNCACACGLISIVLIFDCKQLQTRSIFMLSVVSM